MAQGKFPFKIFEGPEHEQGPKTCDCPPPDKSHLGGCMCNTACQRCPSCGVSMCWKKKHIYSGVDFSSLDPQKYIGRDVNAVVKELQQEFPQAFVSTLKTGQEPPRVKVVTSRQLVVLVDDNDNSKVIGVCPLKDYEPAEVTSGMEKK